MNALNGDPGARAPSHRRSGTKDPLPARSEAPGDEGTRGDAGRPELAAATTPRGARRQPASNYCRYNLQHEQACPSLRSTGVISTSDAGLWSSAPGLPAESQPL